MIDKASFSQKPAVRRRLVPAVALVALVLLAVGFAESMAGEPSSLVQQGAKITGAGESGIGRFGRSVVLSADGTTALIGAPSDAGEVGAAWVLARTGSTWAQQGEKLTGAGEVGEGHFGRGLALSADGDTALVGAPNDDGGLGAVWVFTRTGSTWTLQAKLAGEDESGKGWFGRSVALSADGDTALVGGYVDDGDAGAVWTFTRSGSTWTQLGTKLTGGAEEHGAGEFGFCVALSGDGQTALVSARNDAGGTGAAWVYGRSGSTWVQQGAKLTGTEENGGAYFGGSVALSQNGETALIGGLKDTADVGAAWVFERSGSTWVQQGAKLTGAEESGAGYFGDSVALSADGDVALIGGHKDDTQAGAAWLFERSGSTWVQRGAKLTGGEERGMGQFGWSVALSGDGETALIGGLGDDGKVGAAWAFAPGPPSSGPPSGPSAGGGELPTTDEGSATGTTTTITLPTAAGQGVAAFKASRVRVALVDAKVPVGTRGWARVKLKCIAPVPCRGKLTLALRRGRATRRTRMIATGTFSLRAGRTAPVKLLLREPERLTVGAALGLAGAAGARLGAALTIGVSAPRGAPKRTYAVWLVAQRPATRSQRP